MEKVFVDTDIVLDLLAERRPFYDDAANLFTLADRKKVKIHLSSLTFATLFYMLSRQYSQVKAKKTLIPFKILVNVLAVDDKIIDLALSSGFKDFEDAIQYYSAIENRINILLTRNLKDYKKAEISVMTAESFIKILS